MANFICPASLPSRRPNYCLTSAGLFSAALHANHRKSEPTVLCLRRLCEARGFLFSVFDMARFVLSRRLHVSPYAACCYAIFFKLLIPAVSGRFISGDEAHEARQRYGYQVTPKLSLSCPMHAGNKTDLVQKMSPPVVKQAAYGETRAANIKKKLMKNKLSVEAAAPA